MLPHIYPTALAFSPPGQPGYPITAGDDGVGTVTLNGPAPAGGAVIALSVANITPSGATVTVPASVTVPAGSTTAMFPVTSSQNITYDVDANITATYHGAVTAQYVGHARYDHATFVSQSVPTIMAAGQSYSVSVTLKNDGNTAWTAVNSYYLGSQNQQDNTVWGLSRVALPSSVAANTTVTIPFTVTAPTATGTYNFQWQMFQGGVHHFGDFTTNVPVSVGIGDDSVFVSQTVPSAMTVGQTYPVSVTFKNTGVNTWTRAQYYRLSSENPPGNTTWGAGRISLPDGTDSVAPGQSVTFAFNATPTAAGTFPFQWRMTHDGYEGGVGKFGPFSTEADVVVSLPPPPDAPTSLVAKTDAVDSSARINLTWKASAGADSYTLERQENGGAWNAFKTTTNLSYGNVNLNPDTVYYYRVKATDLGGDSGYSNTDHATTTPTPPASLTATPGNNQNVLTWTASPGANGYNLYRGTSAGGEDLNTPVNGGTLIASGATSYTDTTALNGTAYFYVLRAVNSGGESPVSNEAAATPNGPRIGSLNPATRTAGGGFTLTVNGSGFNADAVVKWNGAEQPTTFVSSTQLTAAIDVSLVVTGKASITVVNPHVATSGTATLTVYPKFAVSLSPNSVTGGDSATGTITLLETAPFVTPVTLTSSDPSATVPASVSVGSGTLTATFPVTTTAVSSSTTATISAKNSNTTHIANLTVGTFDAPTNLVATAGNNQVVLTWTKSTGATGYNVYRSIHSGTETSSPALNSTPLSSATSTYTDSTAVNGTLYYYVVRAINASGESPSSNEASATPDTPHIANLTLSLPTVTGGNTVAGTLTLSGPAPTSGSTVTLTSSDGSTTVPASVTLASGATSKNFTITTASVTSATQVTITGTANKWTQADILTVVPANQSYSIQNLGTIPGNNSCLVFWKDVLPEGAVKGYNIYRQIAGGSRTKLNSAPQVAPYYADTGLSNGTTYQYQVAVVDAGGTEKTVSSFVSVVPATSIPILSWMGSPTGDVSGTVNLYTQLSTGGNTANLTLLVDGKLAGGGGISANISDTADQLSQARADLDTAALTNGTHVVQAFGPITANTIGITSPITISVNNVFSSFVVDDILQADLGQVCEVDAVAPANTSSWVVQVIHDDDSAQVRSWSGSGNTIHLAWDGRDVSGNYVAEDNYTVQVTTQQGTSSAQFGTNAATTSTGNRPTVFSASSPKALTLLNLGCEADNNLPTNNINDLEVGQAIRVAFKNTKALDPSYYYKILSNTISPQPRVREAIRGWLGSSVVDFCFTPGHGNPPLGTRGTSDYIPRSVTWGDLHLYAEPFTPGSKYAAVAIANPNVNIIASTATNNRLYHFVFLDACNTAGGTDANGNASSPDDVWARAFNIGASEDYASCFLGWNGFGITNTLKNRNPSYWQRWRKIFWGRLGNNYTVQQSFTFANMNTPGIIEALPDGRVIYPNGTNNGQSTAQFYGDPISTMLQQQ